MHWKIFSNDYIKLQENFKGANEREGQAKFAISLSLVLFLPILDSKTVEVSVRRSLLFNDVTV